ncbi:MAG: sorbitol-6-phosphate dehydrogenase [Kiritimatiellae bacterium]|nr:sorbitol-6-phosphate dehydrogenase [Kiritimatiellia bacterium]
MRLKDKRAIVTGAGQGLGNAIAERLLTEGCRVVISDVQPELLKTATDIFQVQFDRKAIINLKCDVTRESEVEHLVDTAERKLGGLDIFVANAGILISGALTEFQAADWRKVIEVNLVGQMLCMKHALRRMRETGGGSYVQVNSKSGKKGSYKNSAYAASKFGAIGLLQSAALELAEFGVRVNAVCPGNLLDSPLWKNSLFEQYAANQGLSVEEVRRKYVEQVPMKRPCTYEDVCNVIVFLASEESAYMTGQAINVTGGQEMR